MIEFLLLVNVFEIVADHAKLFFHLFIGIGVDNDGVQVLAASSVPWVLDADIRRRYMYIFHITHSHRSASHI